MIALIALKIALKLLSFIVSVFRTVFRKLFDFTPEEKAEVRQFVGNAASTALRRIRRGLPGLFRIPKLNSAQRAGLIILACSVALACVLRANYSHKHPDVVAVLNATRSLIDVFCPVWRPFASRWVPCVELGAMLFVVCGLIVLKADPSKHRRRADRVMKMNSPGATVKVNGNGNHTRSQKGTIWAK